MKSALNRLKTFNGWQCTRQTPKRLADAGFYYTQFKDYVRCAFCSLTLSKWCEEDIPLLEHLRHNLNCPFVNGHDVGNVPLQQDSLSDVCGHHEMLKSSRALKNEQQLTFILILLFFLFCFYFNWI